MQYCTIGALLGNFLTSPLPFLTRTYDSSPPLPLLTHSVIMSMVCTDHARLSRPSHQHRLCSLDSLSEESFPKLKSWLPSPTAIPKRIVLIMAKTVAKPLIKTVMVNVSGMAVNALTATATAIGSAILAAGTLV